MFCQPAEADAKLPFAPLYNAINASRGLIVVVGGLSVGSVEGLADGLTEGIAVGLADGDSEGEREGREDASALGA